MFERFFLFINKQFDIATQGVRSKNKLTVKVRTHKSKDDFGFNLNLNSIYKLFFFKQYYLKLHVTCSSLAKQKSETW